MSSDWCSYRLAAEDVLFFRDGKPASLGQDHYLRSLFPPFPSTLYGAIRTRRLLDEGIELAGLGRTTWARLKESLRRELGDWGGFGTVELRGPFLVKDDQALLPAPADLGLILPERGKGESEEEEAERPKQVVRYVFHQSSEEQTTWSHPLALAHPFSRRDGGWVAYQSPKDGPEPQSAARWFLTPAGVARWAQGALPQTDDLVRASDLWSFEVRTGLKLNDDSRQAQEHMLYTFGYVRLARSVSLGFELRGSNLRAAGWLRLGGDGRPVRLEAATKPLLPTLEAESLADGRFLLSLVTPALSDAGAYPPGFAAHQLRGRVGGVEAALVGGLVRSSILIGGWNMAERRAKPLRRAIPAGSVFGFQTDAGSDAIASLHGTNLSGFGSECLARQGFGLSIVGTMPRKDA